MPGNFTMAVPDTLQNVYTQETFMYKKIGKGEVRYFNSKVIKKGQQLCSNYIGELKNTIIIFGTKKCILRALSIILL